MEYEALRKVTAAILGMDPEEIRPDMTFLTDLGADSLDVYQIVMGVEEKPVSYTHLTLPTNSRV